MTIGVQYWNEGGSAPGTFTDVVVNQCFIRPAAESVYQAKGFDLTKLNFRAQRYKVRIEVGPQNLAGANGTALLALIHADYVRVHDDRYTDFGGANTIDLCHAGDTDFTRELASRLAEDVTIELEAVEAT